MMDEIKGITFKSMHSTDELLDEHDLEGTQQGRCYLVIDNNEHMLFESIVGKKDLRKIIDKKGVADGWTFGSLVAAGVWGRAVFNHELSHHGYVRTESPIAEAEQGSHGSSRVVPVARERTEVERLRKELDEAKLQIELLKTRVADLRRGMARETQRFDQLQSHCGDVTAQNTKLVKSQDNLIGLLNDRAKANDSIVCQMIAEAKGKIRMHESYFGQVRHVADDTVVVIYEVDGNILEQVYERKQFKDGLMPIAGTCVKTLVFVIEYESEIPNTDSEASESSDEPSHRTHPTGPINF